VHFFVLFGEQFCEVFRIAGTGYAAALGAEVLVVADAVGSVNWQRVMFFGLWQCWNRVVC